MDFAPDDAQLTAASVARETLAREPTESAWKALAEAGLLSLAVPSRLGGDGLGVLEVAAVLTEVGRAAALLPALPTLAFGVLPVVRFGTERQQEELLPDVASGDRVLTAALRPTVPATVDGGEVSGAYRGVAYAATAHRVLVPTDTGLFLVDPHAAGVSLTRTPTSRGMPEFTMRLDGVRAEPLGDSGAVAALHRFAVAGACAVGDGVLAGALALSAEHVRTREQFGKPLATFQAVAQQIADVYVTSRTLHLAASSACWRLGNGMDADADLDVAAYWLAEQTPGALRTCHHLHGGLGLDITYPLHRYSSAAKDLVRLLGGAERRLELLGARVAG